MNLCNTIIVMSAFGVISDSILIAFYPQFFELRYGLNSSVHVGAYIAAISIAVMCALPLWAKLARKIEIMHLLVVTQGIAGLLGIASAWAPDVISYWVLTMLMFMTKASYLLMFPYLMRHEKPDNHALIIGLLSVVIHFGGILGASIGGFFMQSYGPTLCVMLMAVGDFVQMGLCLYLILTNRVIKTVVELSDKSSKPIPRSKEHLHKLLTLSFLMLVFDLGAYLVRPFFSVYWEASTNIPNNFITGIVFSIPAGSALLALFVNKYSKNHGLRVFDNTTINLVLACIGLLLQSVPEMSFIILGRLIFGWGMFQVIVKLEVTLFKISTPDNYARDFSVTNFFQNFGVLLASFISGYLVTWFEIHIVFVIAAVLMLATIIIDRVFFGVDHQHAQSGAMSHAQ